LRFSVQKLPKFRLSNEKLGEEEGITQPNFRKIFVPGTVRQLSKSRN